MYVSFIMLLLILCYNSNTAGCKAMVSDHALLKQRYHILGKVGEGGFGAIYKAEDTEFDNRLVAVKEMSEDGLAIMLCKFGKFPVVSVG
jgi:hypothetical protein